MVFAEPRYDENEKIIVRLENEIATGQIDAYGDSLGTGENILLDYKVTSSFKARKALGFHQVDVPTGEVYKTGIKKGQPKYKKEWRDNMLKYPRNMHGGELWAKIEVLENVLAPLFK